MPHHRNVCLGHYNIWPGQWPSPLTYDLENLFSNSHLYGRWSSYDEVSFQWHPEAARATNTQQIWRQEFLGSRSSTVERSSTRTAAAGTFIRFFQTIFENTSLWRLKRLVSLSTYRRYINKCIYLSYLTNIYAKFHWNQSAKYRDHGKQTQVLMDGQRTDGKWTDGQPDRQLKNIMPPSPKLLLA